MSPGGGLDRIVRLFVAPAAERPSLTPYVAPREPAVIDPPPPAWEAGEEPLAVEGAASPPRAASVTVLCRPADSPALGPLVAMALLRASRSRAGLVCAWPAPMTGRVGAPACPAARRLHTTLAMRGLEARVLGSLALVSLAGDPCEAAVMARRAAAAAPGPVVNVLAGPRPDALAPLLHDADRVLVAARPTDPVCELALAGLAAEGLDSRPLPAPEVGAARTLAAAGLPLPGAMRGALAEALEGLA